MLHRIGKVLKLRGEVVLSQDNADLGRLQALVERLQNGNQSERSSAARTLGEIGDDSAIEPLLAALKNRRPGGKTIVIESLGKIAARSTNPDVLQQVLELLAQQIKSGTGLDKAAAHSIARFGEAALTYLTPLLSDDDPHVSKIAATAISEIGAPAFPLLTTMLNHSSTDVRNTALDGLVRLLWFDPVSKSKEAQSALLSALAHQDASLRARAAYYLGLLKDSAFVPQHLGALGDNSPEVRANAALALGKSGSQDVIGPLITALTDTPIQKQVIYALGKIGDGAAIASLRMYWDTADNSLRFLVAASLARCGDESGIDVMAKACVESEDAEQVIQAIDALGEAALKYPAYTDRLVPILAARLGDHRSPHGTALNHLAVGNTVNNHARGALEKIGTPEALKALDQR